MEFGHEKVVTISIAAYNMEKYIRETLDSLIDERIMDDMEVFIIDDGGADRTLEIAQEYADRYPGTFFPIHKENGGYGSTLNESIPRATGKYFRVLDGDDWLITENLYDWIQVLKRENADAVMTPRKTVNQKTGEEKICDFCKGMDAGIYPISQARFTRYWEMHQTTFRVEVLKKASKKLLEHSLYTDLEFVSYPIPYVNTIYISHQPIYAYRIGREGQSISSEKLQKHYVEHYNVFKRIVSFQYDVTSMDRVHSNMLELTIADIATSHFGFLFQLPCSRDNKELAWDFYLELKKESQKILYMAQKKSKKVRIFVLSRGLLYPIICKAVELKNR